MENAVENRLPAWQPLTPQGIAAFAGATWGRLWLVQLLIAGIAAGAVVYFLHAAWFPVVAEGIRHLPGQGQIRVGTLQWPGSSPQTLGQNRFFACAVDLEHSGEARSPADVQVEFGRHEVRIFSLLGFVPIAYRVGWVAPFNRPELEPWWGAWSPALLAVAAGLVIAGLLAMWAILATLYCVPVWLLGFFTHRDLGWAGSWRVAGAALMPGALFLTGAILAYSWWTLGLVELLLAWALHWVIGWMYLPLSVWRVPRLPRETAGATNPFDKPEPPGQPETDQALKGPHPD